jgi:hypothetical protein
LACFVCHLVVVFVGLRWALGLRRVGNTPQVTYDQALWLVLCVTACCLVVAWLNRLRKTAGRRGAGPSDDAQESGSAVATDEIFPKRRPRGKRGPLGATDPILGRRRRREDE